MKKIVFISIVVSCLFSLSVFANGSSEVVEEKVYELKIANPSNPEDNCVKAFYEFEKLVEDKSNGRIDVQVFDSGQLGAHRDYIEQMQMGSLQAGEINTSVLSGFDSKFMVFSLPYIASDVDHLKQVLDEGLGEKLSSSLEETTKLKVIGWMIRSPRNVYNSRNAINTADDFKGMKTRVMESPIMMKTFELLGAIPVPLSASERYMALQTGVVDGAENSVGIIVAQKEYEVTDYVSLTAHSITPNIIAVDINWFNKLPKDLQDVVVECGKQAGDYATKLDADNQMQIIQQLEELGMEVNNIADKSSFIDKVAPIYSEYRDEIGGEIIDAFMM